MSLVACTTMLAREVMVGGRSLTGAKVCAEELTGAVQAPSAAFFKGSELWVIYMHMRRDLNRRILLRFAQFELREAFQKGAILRSLSRF